MDTSQQTTVIPIDRVTWVVASTAAEYRREASSRGGDTDPWRTRGASCASARHQLEPGVGGRRLYLAGRLGERKPGIKLLPVRVSESKSAAAEIEPVATRFTEVAPARPGTIHIELHQVRVRIEAGVEPAFVRVLLECLRA